MPQIQRIRMAEALQKPRCLVIVGLGLSAGEITEEARTALQSASTIFVMEPLEHLPEALQDAAAPVVSLDPLFDLHASRIDGLRACARQVLDKAAQTPGVVWAFSGHPSVGSFPVSTAIKEGRARGIEVGIWPGVSSIDTFFSDCGVDPLAAGLQIVSGRHTEKLTATLPALILCPGYVATTNPTERIIAWARSIGHLVSLWGPDEPFWVYRRNGDSHTLESRPCADLVSVVAEGPVGSVLVAGPSRMLEECTDYSEISRNNKENK